MKKYLELTDEQLIVALKNVGCHLETCGACAETFYSGSTSMEHEGCPREKEFPVHIIFDGPPSHESGRFVEVENDRGESVGGVGEWRERSGGLWSLDGLFYRME